MAGLAFRPRSWAQLAGLGALAAALLLAAGWERVVAAVQNRDLAEPVEIEARGVPASQAGLIAFWYTGIDNRTFPLSTYKSPLRWRTDSWLPGFQMTAAQGVLEGITELRITVGRRTAVLPARAFAGWRRAVAPPDVTPVTGEPVVTLQVPLELRGPTSTVNWPAGKTLQGEVLKALFWLPGIVLILLLFHRAAARPAFRQFLVKGFMAPPDAHPANRVWTVTGFLFVVVCLVILERRQPFYFTQDDNFAQFLPVIEGACRALLAGHLPVWNPSQYMGSPAMTLGVYALTYPFTWVAWLLARFVFGNEHLTIEVFAIGHIVAGYFVTVRALRAAGMRPLLSSLGAVCFVLSGFSLVFGRSWYYMLPVLVWTPALVLATEKLSAAEAGWRWALSTGLIIGLFFHAGNAQMWFYGIMFFTVAVILLLAARTIDRRNALWAFPALLLGAAIASPVLMLQMAETSNIDRTGGQGASIGSAIAHMMLPLGSLVAHPDGWGGYQNSPRGEMFYIGLPFALTTLLAGCALTAMLILYRQQWRGLQHLLGRNVWLICAMLAYVLALGRPGILWDIMASLPVLNKFNVPAKFLGYVSLFSVIAGGLLIERTLALRNRMGAWLLSSLGFGLMLLHVCLAGQSFYDYSAHPYPVLPHEFAALLREQPPQRVMAIGPDRSIDSHYVESLRNNFATTAGVYAMEGYDPLVSTRPEDKKVATRLDTFTAAAAAAYGVGWVVVFEPGLEWHFSDTPKAWPMEVTDPKDRHRLMVLKPALNRVSRGQYASLYELRGSAPLAFVADQAQRALPVSMDWSGVHVHLAGIAAGTRVVINVLGRPFMHLQSGLAWTPDEWGRVTVHLPAETDDLYLAYSPPWRRGLAAGLVLLLTALGSGMLLSRFRSVPHAARQRSIDIAEPVLPLPERLILS